jgi:hypothetical protein
MPLSIFHYLYITQVKIEYSADDMHLRWWVNGTEHRKVTHVPGGLCLCVGAAGEGPQWVLSGDNPDAAAPGAKK